MSYKCKYYCHNVYFIALVYALHYHCKTNTKTDFMMYNKRSYGVFPRTIGGLMEDVLQNGWNRVSEEVSAYNAPVNILETDNSYELHLVAPGLKKEDFKINLDKNVLSVSAEKKVENAVEGKRYSKREYSYNSFVRSFTLPETADAANIEAEYTDGVLKLNVAKKEEAKIQSREIAVK